MRNLAAVELGMRCGTPGRSTRAEHVEVEFKFKFKYFDGLSRYGTTILPFGQQLKSNPILMVNSLRVGLGRRTWLRASSPAIPNPHCLGPEAARLMLSAAQLDACHARAEALLLPTIREYAALDREVDRARWSHLGSRGGVSAYRERLGSSSGSVALLAVGTLRGQFEAVLDALYCDSTDAMRVQSAVLCPRVRHGRVLNVLQRRSAREPASFTGVKRASLRVLGGRVLADRDVLYFEKLAAVRQASGRRMAYHLRESLDLPSTSVSGPSSSSKGSSRGFLSLCCLVEDLGDRRVGVFLLGTVDGFGPPLLAAGALTDLALAVTRTLELARARQLGALLAACKPPPTRATLSLTKRCV